MPASPIRPLALLAARDPDLARAAALAGPLPDRSRPPGFATLLQIVCAQQVSTAAAASVWQRLQAAVRPLTPAGILALSDDGETAGLGLGRRKLACCRALAEAVAGGRLDLDNLADLPDAEAVAALSAVHGIGRWTAEIYLLFALRRSDVWPAGDLALQAALHHLKRLPARPDRREMDRLAEPWRPHRAAAAELLWGYYAALRRGEAGALPAYTQS